MGSQLESVRRVFFVVLRVSLKILKMLLFMSLVITICSSAVGGICELIVFMEIAASVIESSNIGSRGVM